MVIKRNDFHQRVPAITVVAYVGWSKQSHKHSYNAKVALRSSLVKNQNVAIPSSMEQILFCLHNC